MRFAVVTGLSAIRIPLAGAFLFLYLDETLDWRRMSAFVLAVMLVSDVLDGWLARRWMVTTTFGYVLDGVADRASYVAALLAVSERFSLHPLVPYGIITRDLILYAARALSPGWSSTIATTRVLSKAYALTLRVGLAGYFVLDYGDLFSLFSNGIAPWDRYVLLLHSIMAFVLLFAYVSLVLVLCRYFQGMEQDLRHDRTHNWDQG